MRVARGNLFAPVELPAQGERFEILADVFGTTIERIVSSVRPEPVTYDQEQAEWVVLLEGEATLEVQGEVIALRAGDHLLLPPHTRHRVLETSQGARWLAVHVRPPSEASEQLDVTGSE
jgi:cupin 2 domain-containing protein